MLISASLYVKRFALLDPNSDLLSKPSHLLETDAAELLLLYMRYYPVYVAMAGAEL